MGDYISPSIWGLGCRLTIACRLRVPPSQRHHLEGQGDLVSSLMEQKMEATIYSYIYIYIYISYI